MKETLVAINNSDHSTWARKYGLDAVSLRLSARTFSTNKRQRKR